MLSYRHQFHAGSFTDVFKHALLTRRREVWEGRVDDRESASSRAALVGEDHGALLDVARDPQPLDDGRPLGAQARGLGQLARVWHAVQQLPQHPLLRGLPLDAKATLIKLTDRDCHRSEKSCAGSDWLRSDSKRAVLNYLSFHDLN